MEFLRGKTAIVTGAAGGIGEAICKKLADLGMNLVITGRKAQALEELAELRGDIVPLAGKKNLFRYKIPQYRIIFEWVKGEIVITVIEINTRTNIKY